MSHDPLSSTQRLNSSQPLRFLTDLLEASPSSPLSLSPLPLLPPLPRYLLTPPPSHKKPRAHLLPHKLSQLSPQLPLRTRSPSPDPFFASPPVSFVPPPRKPRLIRVRPHRSPVSLNLLARRPAASLRRRLLPSSYPVMESLAPYDVDRRLGADKGDDDMQVIDISEQCDSDSDSQRATDDEDDDDFLHRPLSPSNPFLLICNSLCSSPSSAASIHVLPLALPPPSKQDSRIPLSSLPDDLRAFLVAQQSPLVKDCEADHGLLPAWLTPDHVKLLTQLFDKHVAQPAGYSKQHSHKADWEESDKGRDGKGGAGKDKGDMRGDKKGGVASVSTSAGTSSISSSSSSFSASSQQASPLYSLHTASEQTNTLPSSPHHYASYTPPRPLPSTPVPPPLLSPSLSKQTSRIAEMIRRLYGLSSEEKGHKLLGHSCLTQDDQSLALEHKSDLLYGEVLPEGVSRMFDSEHLDLMTARTVYDLGSGLGKLAMQAFLQFPHLDWVCGVELARSRSLKGFDAVRKLSKMRLSSSLDGGASNSTTTTVSCGAVEEGKDGSHIRLTETIQSTASSSSSYSKCLGRSKKSKKHRFFELRCADLFTVHDAFQADVVICETKFPEEKYRDLAHFMSHMKSSVRVLTYEDLDVVYGYGTIHQLPPSPPHLSLPLVTALTQLLRLRCAFSLRYIHMSNPFVRLENNHTNDRFYTTWAPNYGYRFHLWRKRGDGGGKQVEEEKREEKQFKQE